MAQTSTARPSGSSPAVSEDRLSSLPDALLHTLMSFLTARQAVQTSVLSRRWAGLWCSMPCLVIDHREFKYEESDTVNNWSRCETVESGRFVDFVHGLQGAIAGHLQVLHNSLVSSSNHCLVAPAWLQMLPRSDGDLLRYQRDHL
jgi:hypothetical protein